MKDIEDLEGIWKGFKKQLRKNIEKAEKAGISVEEGGIDELKLIIGQVSARYHDQDIGFHTSNEYLLDLFHTFYPDHLKIFMAKKDGEPVTGILVTAYRKRLSIWVGATQTALKGIYPADLLQWKIMDWGNEHGYDYCEILGANVPSISYFKSRYNFDLEIYFEVKREDRMMEVMGGAYRALIHLLKGHNGQIEPDS